MYRTSNEAFLDAKKKMDTSSIKTTTLFSFVLFAVFLMAVIWGLTNFFLDKYYESMKTQETIRVASSLENQYRLGHRDFDDFSVQTARSNGIYIRLDEGGESSVYDGTVALQGEASFIRDINSIRKKLENSPLQAVSITIKDTNSGNGSRLIYATYINTGSTVSTLYIISPLSPDSITLRIAKTMLIYTTIIVLLIAILIAFYLSDRLARPIQSITASASELSKGNHNVHFDGGNFTETKELAKTLNRASYELEKTEFYQREILANVSHDLKTPLTMIRSYAEKIIDISGNNPEKREADLHVIISETERLNRLVTEMMTVSNLQSNNVELHKEVFDIVEAAREVYESFSVLTTSEGFEINFQECKPSFVEGDKTRITQVMSNFVSNAVKYSGDNKYVEIQLKRVGKGVAFHCIDHGIGIPAEDQQHVWDRYYRTSANHERDIEGTGLGLSIVKGILNLHGAAFGVNSQEGKGSDFWFELVMVKKPTENRKLISKADSEYDEHEVFAGDKK